MPSRSLPTNKRDEELFVSKIEKFIFLSEGCHLKKKLVVDKIENKKQKIKIRDRRLRFSPV